MQGLHILLFHFHEVLYIYIYIYIYIHRKNKAVIEIHESEIIGHVVPAYPNTYIFAIFFIL